MRRLLCWLGRHDWRLSSVESRLSSWRWSGEEDYAEKHWVASVYRCRRCPARRVEATP